MNSELVPMTMDEQKALSLDILKNFAKFCDDHGITYYLAYGTLLGAVRHKGYIPWDDDIDVFVPRDDYKKLIDIYNKEKTDENYELISPYDKNTIYAYIKIIDRRTVKIEEGIDYPAEPFGVDIDVFPLDGVSGGDEFKAGWEKIKKLYFYRSLTLLKKEGRPLHKKIALSLIRVIFNRMRIQRKIDKIIEKISTKDFEFYTDLSCDYAENAILYPVGWFGIGDKVQFEDAAFNAPSDHHKFLTAMYGDYMTPPPKDKQITHHLNNCFRKADCSDRT